MYLTELNDVDKKDFLTLAKYAMGLNGEFKQQELAIFSSFQHECDLPKFNPDVNTTCADKALTNLSAQSEKIKKIVMVELLGIMLADTEICDAERLFIDKMASSFDFEVFQVKRMERWVISMNELVEEGYRIIGG